MINSSSKELSVLHTISAQNPGFIETQPVADHFDTFYRNSIGLQNSDDKRGSIWSNGQCGLVRNKSVNQTPTKSGFEQ
jgi:hypothetical protein